MTAPPVTITGPAPTPAGSGPRHRGHAAQVLRAVVIGTATMVVLIGLALPGERPAGAPLSVVGGVALAVAATAVGQMARLRLRLGRGSVSVSWGEAAFVLALALAPPGWVPAVTLAGAAAAWLLSARLDQHRPIPEIWHLVSSLTLGAAGGTVVAAAVGGAAPGARGAPALLAGAVTYLFVTLGLAALTLWLRRDAPAGQILVRTLHAKAPVFAGNVLAGLSALVVLRHHPLWLPAAAPVLWLMQRTYRHHVNGEQGRRLWATFARAVAALPDATERQVAEAGLRGAMDVFAARRVEIDVVRPAGGHHRYAADGPGHDGAAAGLPGPVLTRAMAVAGTRVGELSVWLGDAARSAYDEPAVSAYGDALAGALHNAAAHERLFALQARVARDSVQDAVTGLVNRRALLADGDTLLGSLDRERHVALLLLDLNDFREVNGTLGHRCGDEVLRTVAVRLHDLSRDGDLVARVGDDEFAVLLPTVATLIDSATPLHKVPSPLPRAVRRAHEIVEHLAMPMEVAGVRLAVEGAVGVVVSRAGCADMAELVRRAALALDQAKALRLPVATYDTGRDATGTGTGTGTGTATATDRLAMLAELHDALLGDDQILIALQPAVDLATGVPTGVEALSRWQHPRRGELPPADFISTVENSGLLGPFTRYVLDRSLAAAAAWAAHGIDLPVSVNVSARSLLDATLPGQIADLLRRHRLPAASLVLEITESMAVSEQKVIDEVLAALRRMGVQLSVDDFGTGFSSLAFVTRVEVDELKVDRSFVDAMIDSPVAAAVVRGAVELGARLGVRVVAEGVETTEQRAALLALGCPVAQGYHFCRPLSAGNIVTVLRQLGEAAQRPAWIVPLRADDAS